MYIGFAFFLMCVGYISLRRTPAFIKQPVYALLHMKQGGQPFTHQGEHGVGYGRGGSWLVACAATHRNRIRVA